MATNHFIANAKILGKLVSKGVVIHDGVHNCIVAALKSNRLNALWDSNPVMCGIRMDGYNLEVEIVQFDAQHLQYNRFKLPVPAVGRSKNLDIVLPLDVVVQIVKKRKGLEDYAVYFSNKDGYAIVVAENEDFRVEVGNSCEIAKTNTMEDAINVARSLKCTNSFIVNKGKAIHKILETGIELYEPKTVMRINVHPRSHNADFIVDGGSGSMLATLPLNPSWPEKETVLSVDMFLLRDILPKVKDWMRINIHNNRILYFKKKHQDGSLEVRCCSLS